MQSVLKPGFLPSVYSWEPKISGDFLKQKPRSLMLERLVLRVSSRAWFGGGNKAELISSEEWERSPGRKADGS